MTTTGTGLPTPGESADETTIGDALGFEVVNLLGADDIPDTVAELVSRITADRAALPNLVVGQDYVYVDAMYDALGDAVSEGAVPQGSVLKAVAWAIAVGGATISSVDEWHTLFLHYAVNNGHPVSNPGTLSAGIITQPPTSVNAATGPLPTAVAQTQPASVTVGVSVPEPDSPGGRLVTAAETAIKRVNVAVPGLTPTEAKGISLALAQAYQNFLTVAVSVANSIEDQVSSLSSDISDLRVELSNLSGSAAGEQQFVAGRLAIDETRIDNLINAATSLQTELTDLQAQITSIATAPPVTTPSPQPITGVPFTVADAALVATIPALATSASVAGLQGELDTTNSEVATLETQAQTAGIPETPTTMTDLEDCCEENSAVTGPIKAGGATPSSLLGLGSLLSIAGLLGVAASIVSGLAAIFDLDDSITGTFWTAEVISGYAARAANVAIADTSWSRTMAVTVD